MTQDVGTFEKLLAAWREAEAKAEALRQFRDAGGEHRLRISTDINDQVPARLLEEMMQDGGFKFLISKAITIAEKYAEDGKQAFLAEASGAHLLGDFGG